ncbi:MAG TPA: hypothetical protein VFQ97_01875 [Gallionella sp.]|nr:hypothetical protein [Gallionella sp.]
MRTNLTDMILWKSLAIFLIIGALMGVAVSLLLIFKPHLMERINRVANRWISTRRMNQFLDRSISIERWFYRHHRTLGILIMLGACYILVYFGLLFDKAIALQRLSGYVPVLLLRILLDALPLALLSGAAVALITGLFVWLRPSLLRGIEKEANQWVSTRRASKVLDVPHGEVDRFVMGHTQRVGWLLLLGSVYLLFALFRWLV